MKLAFFGDSICVGQGISLERTWAVMLSGYLFRKKSNNKSRASVLLNSYELKSK